MELLAIQCDFPYISRDLRWAWRNFRGMKFSWWKRFQFGGRLAVTSVAPIIHSPCNRRRLCCASVEYQQTAPVHQHHLQKRQKHKLTRVVQVILTDCQFIMSRDTNIELRPLLPFPTEMLQKIFAALRPDCHALKTDEFETTRREVTGFRLVSKAWKEEADEFLSLSLQFYLKNDWQTFSSPDVTQMLKKNEVPDQANVDTQVSNMVMLLNGGPRRLLPRVAIIIDMSFEGATIDALEEGVRRQLLLSAIVNFIEVARRIISMADQHVHLSVSVFLAECPGQYRDMPWLELPIALFVHEITKAGHPGRIDITLNDFPYRYDYTYGCPDELKWSWHLEKGSFASVRSLSLDIGSATPPDLYQQLLACETLKLNFRFPDKRELELQEKIAVAISTMRNLQCLELVGFSPPVLPPTLCRLNIKTNFTPGGGFAARICELEHLVELILDLPYSLPHPADPAFVVPDIHCAKLRTLIILGHFAGDFYGMTALALLKCNPHLVEVQFECSNFLLDSSSLKSAPSQNLERVSVSTISVPKSDDTYWKPSCKLSWEAIFQWLAKNPGLKSVRLGIEPIPPPFTLDNICLIAKSCPDLMSIMVYPLGGPHKFNYSNFKESFGLFKRWLIEENKNSGMEDIINIKLEEPFGVEICLDRFRKCPQFRFLLSKVAVRTRATRTGLQRIAAWMKSTYP